MRECSSSLFVPKRAEVDKIPKKCYNGLTNAGGRKTQKGKNHEKNAQNCRFALPGNSGDAFDGIL